MTASIADVRLTVANVTNAVERITSLAKRVGGFMVSSRVWREGNVLKGQVSIRVPVQEFDGVLKELSAMAVDVTSQTIDSKDVTEEYVDLTAKLQNLEAVERQLLQVMQKAEKIDDILSVQRELTRIGDEIERTKGRVQYLERTSETSLMQVLLEQSGLHAKISVDRAVVKAGERVQFDVEVTGGFFPYSYEWGFGDKSVSTERAPRHAYKSPGNYTVTLKVTDDRGNTAVDERASYVIVLPGWNPASIARNAGHGFVIFSQMVISIAIWLGIFSPVWLVGGGIFYLIWRRRRINKRKQEVEDGS
ncbi:MAG: DUF4349 domain-containing protein [Chloroflexi bacterium]|nr:DUF4349 domain-containing protein [Chloroflexota bacterium]